MKNLVLGPRALVVGQGVCDHLDLLVEGTHLIAIIDLFPSLVEGRRSDHRLGPFGPKQIRLRNFVSYLILSIGKVGQTIVTLAFFEQLGVLSILQVLELCARFPLELGDQFAVTAHRVASVLKSLEAVVDCGHSRGKLLAAHGFVRV